MPRKINSSPPPEVMTWPRAAPVLVIAVIFDALRFMFEWFVFFGPALAAIGCTAGVNSAIGATIDGIVGKGVAGGCAIGAAVGGFFGAAVIGPFGMVMAMAVGLAGWLAIGLYLVTKNARIFKESALWFGGSLLLSEIPFINSLPAFTFTVWKMHRTQIRVEKTAYKKWEKENAALLRQEQERQAFEQSRSLQQTQAEQQQALDNEWAGQMEQQSAEDEEIPEDMREAA